MLLYLTRHGETVENLKKIYMGHSQGGLSPLGHKQAMAIALRLKEIHFDHVNSSDLARARETTEKILSFHTDVPVTYRPDLRELDMGILMGKSYIDFPFHETYPHPTMERKEEMYQRVTSCLAHLIETHFSEDILIVSHEGTMKDMISFLLHHSPQEKEDLWQTKFHNTALFCFEIMNKEEKATTLIYNDGTHLSSLL